MSEEIKTENGAILDRLDRVLKPHAIELPSGESIVAVPTSRGGYIVTSAREFEPQPLTRSGCAHFEDAESLIAWANRMKNDSSAIFASKHSQPCIRFIADYHPTGGAEAGELKHNGKLSLSTSDAFDAWRNTGAMNQAQFAEFLEEHVIELLDPKAEDHAELAKSLESTYGVKIGTPAQLLEVGRGLSLKVTQHVKRAVRLSTGESEFAFSEQHSGANGKPLRIPTAALIGVPVFDGDAPYRLLARLNIRVQDGAVSWHFRVVNADLALEKAFATACDAVQKSTGLPLYRGTAER